METTKTRYQCRHIFTAGRRCQSPSLRGQDIKAVAEPQIRVPHPFRSLSANRVGYRLRKQTTVLPNTTPNPKPSNPKFATPVIKSAPLPSKLSGVHGKRSTRRHLHPRHPRQDEASETQPRS